MQSKIQQYQIVRQIGAGAFGQVLLANKKNTEYAIKKLSQKQIKKVNKLHEPFIEKEVLYMLNQLCKDDQYFVKIFETDTDEDFVYMILEYCSGGTLEDLIQKQKLTMGVIRVIAAKIILILEKLGSFKIVHRDLKPSNFLLTEQGFIKLADFGTAYVPFQFFPNAVSEQIQLIKAMTVKSDQKQRKNSQPIEPVSLAIRRSTFVGTACYMAPELLSDDRCEKQADIWAYGCILYEMLFKKSPFFDTNEGMIWKKILQENIQIKDFPKNYTEQESIDLIDLITKILVKEVELRLGSGEKGYQDIKNHRFFQGIDWNSIGKKPIEQISSIVKTNRTKSQVLDKQKQQKVIISGVVNKKMFFGHKERMMILYSTPKLVYYDPDSGDKKGEIMLVKNTPVLLEDKSFSVTNQKKTYVFKCKNAIQWVEMIKYSIMNAFF